MGVRRTRPAMVRWAASMSASVIAMPYLLTCLTSCQGTRLPRSTGACPQAGNWPVPLASGQSTLPLPEDSRKREAMSDGGPRRIGVSIELKPHAYDPFANPELFDGVLARRCIAFIVDIILIAIPVILAGIFMVVSTVATLGIAGLLYALLSPLFWPLILIWGICYYGFTLGSPASATIGMRVVDLEMRTWYGAPAYFVLGAVHAIVYWITV